MTTTHGRESEPHHHQLHHRHTKQDAELDPSALALSGDAAARADDYVSTAQIPHGGMHMSFHFSYDNGPLLFKWWHPRMLMGYLISLVAIFALAMGAEFLGQLSRSHNALSVHGRFLSKTDDGDPGIPLCEQSSKHFNRRRPLSAYLSTYSFHVVSIAVNFGLMLLVMTFDVGICLAVVSGLAWARTLRIGHEHGRLGSTHHADVESCHG